MSFYKFMRTWDLELFLMGLAYGLLIIIILGFVYFSEKFLHYSWSIIVIATFFSFFFFAHVLGIIGYVKSCEVALRHPESSYLTNETDHNAIVFVHHEKMSKQIFIGAGVGNLIQGLKKLQKFQHYKVYHCFSKNDFIDVYSNPHATSLWIFAHGDYSHIAFGHSRGCGLNYSDLPSVEPKKFIAQLHCSHRGGKSIVDINEPRDQILSHSYRITPQNNYAIRKKLKELQ